MAIFNICNISFHGLRPLALYFSQGFMKKYLSLRLKSSTIFDSTVQALWMQLQLLFILLSPEPTRSSESSITLKCRTEHYLLSLQKKIFVVFLFFFFFFVKGLIDITNVLESRQNLVIPVILMFITLVLLHSLTDITVPFVHKSWIAN